MKSMVEIKFSFFKKKSKKKIKRYCEESGRGTRFFSPLHEQNKNYLWLSGEASQFVSALLFKHVKVALKKKYEVECVCV